MLAIAASSSSICLLRSWFSTWRRFFVDSASLRARAISSSLVLESTIDPCRSFPVLSSSAFPLTASSRSRRASRRSSSKPALSFSDLTLFELRLSICSPRSPIVLLCFMRRAAQVPSWAMLSSSSSALILPSSASRFLLSSTWVAVFDPASSRREAISSISFFSMVRLFSALALAPLSTTSSSSSSSSRASNSLACLEYFEASVASSSIFAPRALPSFSLRATVPLSSAFTRSRSETASWVNLRSPSIFLLAFSTSPLTFFSRSNASSDSSRACSSFPFTLERWLHLSSAAWISSSVFCLPSPTDLFSLPNFVIMSDWCEISSLRVLIWSSLSALSCSAEAKTPSWVWTSPSSWATVALILPIWPSRATFWAFSPLMRFITPANSPWTSAACPSMRVVLSMMSCTADPPDFRARLSSFFWPARPSYTACTFARSSRAPSILASARAILSSYSFLNFPNWVHLRLGLIASQICIHNQVLAVK